MSKAGCAQPNPDVTGVVLAGGLSSRMGRDKARLQLMRGEEPDLLASATKVLAPCCKRVIVVGRDHPAHECYPDSIPGSGPVGGIATALAISGTACMVLSCDLPFMEEDVVKKLMACRLARPDGALSTSYRQCDTGHVESLVAIYEYESLPYFQQCAKEKLLKISRVIPPERQHFLKYSIDEALPFFNINYPADLIVARKVLQMLGR